jgi:hypothetical protein
MLFGMPLHRSGAHSAKAEQYHFDSCPRLMDKRCAAF